LKILILSDSHGFCTTALEAIELESPEMILHLGDVVRDCSVIQSSCPDIPIRFVIGNSDPESAEPTIDKFTLRGKRFFMTHGHLFGVKMSIDRLVNTALNSGADILLFGHTHIPHHSVVENMLVVCPGTITVGDTAYAVLEIKDGEVSCELKQI